jgi:superfamily I DNA/RNA helicase/RecB family exonuclease
MPDLLFASARDFPPLGEGISSQGAVVIGSPQSGKTSRLRGTVKLLESGGVRPDDILVLTPSRVAAAELRDQIALDSLLPAASPRARSISSFAFELLADSQELKLLSGASQERLIRNLVEDRIASGETSNWRLPKDSLLLAGFIQELRDLITVIIENQLDSAQLEALQREFPETRYEIALSVLPDYREELASQGYLDPSQLLVAARQSLGVSSRFSHVLVDDAQNLSEAGLKLVETLLQSAKGYLFGDPDAATMGFRGASPARFIEIGRSLGYQELVLSQSELPTLIAGNLSRLSARIPASLAGGQRLRPVKGAQPNGKLFASTQAESDGLAARLRKAALADKISWSEMVVVARTRNQLEQLSADLSARSIPVRIQGVQRALREQPMALALIDFIQVSQGLGTQESIERLLTSPLVGITQIQMRKLSRELKQVAADGDSRQSLFATLLEGKLQPGYLPRKLAQLIEKLAAAKEAQSCHQIASIGFELADKNLAVLALGGGASSAAANRALDAALELFAAAIRWDERAEGSALDFALAQLETSVPEDSLAPIGRKPAVTLATPSQLTRSYELVCVPRLQEGIWPNLNPRNSLLGAASLQAYLLGRLDDPTLPVRSELADELRMFYRTCGSARSELWLSATEQQDEQPSQFFAMLSAELVAGQESHDLDIRRRVGTLRAALRSGDQSVAPTLAALALAGVPGAHPSRWQGLIESTAGKTKPNSVAASKLASFERCPLHWFASSFGADSGGFQASLGTLLHEALEKAAQPEDVTSYVSENWHSLEFENSWEADRSQRQAGAMAAAISEYLRSAEPLVASEQGFRIEIGQLIVSGKIDRIEQTADGLEVVDLKTGAKKTAAEVAEDRQLAVYQLAIESLYGKSSVGARILNVKEGKPKSQSQPPLTDESRQELESLAQDIQTQLGSGLFVAKVSEHCREDQTCRLLLTKAVTNG